jgi:hypothetical protein
MSLRGPRDLEARIERNQPKSSGRCSLFCEDARTLGNLLLHASLGNTMITYLANNFLAFLFTDIPFPLAIGSPDLNATSYCSQPVDKNYQVRTMSSPENRGQPPGQANTKASTQQASSNDGSESGEPLANRHWSRKRGGALQYNSELFLIEHENLSRTVLKSKVENTTGVPSLKEYPVLETDAGGSALPDPRQPETSTTASRSSVLQYIFH